MLYHRIVYQRRRTTTTTTTTTNRRSSAAGSTASGSRRSSAALVTERAVARRGSSLKGDGSDLEITGALPVVRIVGECGGRCSQVDMINGHVEHLLMETSRLCSLGQTTKPPHGAAAADLLSESSRSTSPCDDPVLSSSLISTTVGQESIGAALPPDRCDADVIAKVTATHKLLRFFDFSCC